jgi:hypothetical protein
VKPRRRLVAVKLTDSDSGLAAKATRIRFGAGIFAKGGAKHHAVYPRPGRYRVLVRARDRAGNRVLRRFEVRVG